MSDDSRDALVARMFGATIGTLELLHVYIGDRLGLYRALADDGPLDAGGLAAAAGINEPSTGSRRRATPGPPTAL